MATIQQSLGMQKRIVGTGQKSASLILGVKALVKHTDIVKNAIKKDGSVGRDGNSGGGASNKEINDIISILKSIKSNVSKIEDHTASMNTILSDFQKNTEELLKKLQPKTSDNVSKWTSIGTSWFKITAAAVAAGIVSSRLIKEGGMGSVREYFDKSIDEKLFGQTESESTATNLDGKQATLETALNNLSSGINTWLSTTRKGSKALEDRHTQMKNGLSSSLATLQQSINDSMANRNENDTISKRREKMMENFKVNLKKFQNQLNLAIVGREQNDLIAARREAMIERFKASLMGLQQAISDALTTRGTGEAIVARREEMIATFKKTFEELALFLKNVFKEPLKIVARQFAVMGFVVITVLQKIESAINDVVNAIGSLKVAGSTLVSSAQNTIIEADKALQSIPSVESAVGASTSDTVNQQSTSDYEISSQKANEINASAGSQSASRQTIINMNSNMPVNVSITNGMDMEMFLRQLGIGVDMAMRSAAEGVPL